MLVSNRISDPHEEPVFAKFPLIAIINQ